MDYLSNWRSANIRPMGEGSKSSDMEESRVELSEKFGRSNR